MSITAIFSGTFDPITLGHIDVVERLSHQYSKVVLMISDSSSKKTLFSSKERAQLAKKAFSKISNVEVVINEGLTVTAAKKYSPCVLVRSVRGGADFEYERTIAEANRLLDSDIETLFIFARPEYVGIASSLVKEIAKNNGDLKPFLSPDVIKALKQKLKD